MTQLSAPPQPPPPPPRSTANTSSRRLLIWGAGGVVGVLVVLAGFLLFGGGGSEETESSGSSGTATGPLVVSSTYTTVEDAPLDDRPGEWTNGLVVHPTSVVTVYNAPSGKPIAQVEPKQFGDTWLPVIDQADGWFRVLLPSKPNGSTGWLRDQNLEQAVTPYRIQVHLGSKTLELFRNGESIGKWTVGIGKPSAPTPTGRTFILGAFTDDDQKYSPVILPLGTHSPTLDSYGGGPGTVAIHTWPTDEVYGTESSDGCIRVPPDALKKLTEVPLGTIVLIDER